MQIGGGSELLTESLLHIQVLNVKMAQPGSSVWQTVNAFGGLRFPAAFQIFEWARFTVSCRARLVYSKRANRRQARLKIAGYAKERFAGSRPRSLFTAVCVVYYYHLFFLFFFFSLHFTRVRCRTTFGRLISLKKV